MPKGGPTSGGSDYAVPFVPYSSDIHENHNHHHVTHAPEVGVSAHAAAAAAATHINTTKPLVNFTGSDKGIPVHNNAMRSTPPSSVQVQSPQKGSGNDVTPFSPTSPLATSPEREDQKNNNKNNLDLMHISVMEGASLVNRNIKSKKQNISTAGVSH